MKELQTNTFRKFLTLSVLVIIGRVFDATTTYFYTPDFTKETNIIVVLFGVGWTSFLIMQLVLTGLVIYLLYYYYFKYVTVIPSDKGLTIKQFTAYLNFNDITAFNKIFYKTPKNKKVMFAAIGYITSLTLISVSYIVGTSTTFLLISEDYRNFYSNGIPVVLYCIIAGLAIFFTLKFYRTEYEKYRNTAGNSTLPKAGRTCEYEQ